MLRFLTGFALATVYPVGMKIMATWMKEDCGTGLGVLVDAVIVGSATPHLIWASGGINEWRQLMYATSGLALLSGMMVGFYGRLGPYRVGPAPFRWRYVGQVLRERSTRLANFGYLGHMWELYAMWTWIPIFLLDSFELTNSDSFFRMAREKAVPLIAFTVIAIGGLGSFVAGFLGDCYGRTRTTIGCMLLSGTCSLLIGLFFGRDPLLISVVALVWGLAIVADSAQFSTATSELVDPAYIGTALTIQTCLAFLLTMASIRLMPILVSCLDWRWAFTPLALGPAFGIWAMTRLKNSPAASKLAGGRG